ncbi:MAG: hypothetical protein HC890_05915 [Chloroflexaceae bacterium]|nr:hypothetical protein [Chloroflexaceae bacterium]
MTQSVWAASLNNLPDLEQWQKPHLELPQGDLVYPDWFEGTWQVTCTETAQLALLAPDIVTPGFESNRRYLNEPVEFPVRFRPSYSPFLTNSILAIVKPGIVGDRAFNGWAIARAYLGDRAVLSVKVDPDNPNRQVTFLSGQRQLIATITGRRRREMDGDRFLATEISQQVFRSPSQIYFNEVEITTDYQRLDDDRILADQVAAIYLSPQDPDYFTAANRPVALYRYRLQLQRQ